MNLFLKKKEPRMNKTELVMQEIEDEIEKALQPQQPRPVMHMMVQPANTEPEPAPVPEPQTLTNWLRVIDARLAQLHEEVRAAEMRVMERLDDIAKKL